MEQKNLIAQPAKEQENVSFAENVDHKYTGTKTAYPTATYAIGYCAEQ